MIQRIQSLFLLVAGLLVGLLFNVDLATVTDVQPQSLIFADGKFTLLDNIGLSLFYGIAGLLSIIAIFLFNNRKLQSLLGRLAGISLILGSILGVVVFMKDSPNMTVSPQDTLFIYLPILVLVSLLLALRFIKKDSQLVKSMDRLR